MNMLRRTNLRQFLRFVETSSPTSSGSPPLPPAPKPKFLAEKLNNRALIRVQGEEIVPFLQGLITNDMNHLARDQKPSMFTMFLNNSGRVLYDAIVYPTPGEDTFIIECDRELSPELRRHLRVYRVRRKIDIECITSEYSPWVVYNPDMGGVQPKANDTEVKNRSTELIYTPDPRVRELGARLIQPQDSSINDVSRLFPNAKVEESSESNYSKHRYTYGVGEGGKDHPPGKCFPLEANCDFLHGVSFHKGCYVGQELTARVYHTGVIRKRLMPLKLSTDPEPNITAVQTQAGTVIGNVRGASHRRALALLRVEQALNTQELMIDGEPCSTYKPEWWPKVVPTKPNMRRE